MPTFRLLIGLCCGVDGLLLRGTLVPALTLAFGSAVIFFDFVGAMAKLYFVQQDFFNKFSKCKQGNTSRVARLTVEGQKRDCWCGPPK